MAMDSVGLNEILFLFYAKDEHKLNKGFKKKKQTLLKRKRVFIGRLT